MEGGIRDHHLVTQPRDLELSTDGDASVVSLNLHAADRDACTGQRVEQVFAGAWRFGRAGHEWVAEDIEFEKVSGETTTLSAAECPESPSPWPRNPKPCTPGYDPCLEPASDYDCAGGTGYGPEHVAGPVAVSGSDPYGLDDDADGVGCE